RSFEPRTRPEGDSRPPRDREFTGTPRGPRRSDAGGERPAFEPRLRPDSERGAGAAFKGEVKRPGRNFSDKPVRACRPEGGCPVFADRADRPSYSDRPARSAPRPDQDNLGSEVKTYGKPKMRPDGKPYPKRDGAAPQRGPKPGGRTFGGPSGGAGRPAGGPGRPAGGGGRPSSGAGRPSGGGRPSSAGRPSTGGRPGAPRRPK
ncbi:MAG: hypothetical protein MO852_17220, partial [Candidatus Devosia euplotis]|nr:hypothetical protein [Candidatus Devosia euplotis]